MTEKKEVRLLTAIEVAARYGLTVSWVYGCRSLPRRKVGKYLRFSLEELQAWEKKLPDTKRTFVFEQIQTKTVTLIAGPYSGEETMNRLKRERGEFVLQFDIESPE